MKKHKYNIYPEAKAEDYSELLESIRNHGFDPKFPIVTYQGEILDGWNRFKACTELGITPPLTAFDGSDMEAFDFMVRTNKRRNLNSGQRACIGVEAKAIVEAIQSAVEEERRAKQAATQSKPQIAHPDLIKPERAEPMAQKIAPQPTKTEKETRTKIAEAVGSNRTYINQAAKIEAVAPEVFEKVKAGKMTMQDAAKAVRAIPTDPWLDDEKERKATVEAGGTVIANQQRDKNLIQWAESKGKVCRVDRGTPFGNPFILGTDGDRDAVCDSYVNHYLPNKPSITSVLPSLKGKVLVCHCYPLRCHAESLITIHTP